MSSADRPSSPRGDDDSWGKLASDLFGINLDADEDLDVGDLLPPAVVPPSPPPAAAAPPAPAAEPAPSIDLSDMDFEADEAEPEEEVDDDPTEVELADEGE